MSLKAKHVSVSLIIASPLLLKGFSSLLLTLDCEVHSSYNSGKELIASFLPQNLPQIVFIDVDKQQTGAIETTEWLTEHYPSIKVIVLSLDPVQSLIEPVLDKGAVGYILKTADRAEIKDAVRQVLTKGHYFPSLRQQNY